MGKNGEHFKGSRIQQKLKKCRLEALENMVIKNHNEKIEGLVVLANK